MYQKFGENNKPTNSKSSTELKQKEYKENYTKTHHKSNDKKQSSL